MDHSDVSVIPKVDVVGKVGPKFFFGSDLKRELVALSITLVNWKRLKSEAANFFHQSLVKPEAHKLAFVTSKLVGFY